MPTLNIEGIHFKFQRYESNSRHACVGKISSKKLSISWRGTLATFSTIKFSCSGSEDSMF